MKIVFISDTHGATVSLPTGDLLVHSGDCSDRGDLKAIQKFNEYLGRHKDKFKYGILFVPGNHDILFQNEPELAIKNTNNAKVLINESIIINDVKFYGSPITPTFFNWAFMRDRGLEIREVWNKIPMDTNVLITHGPPKNILDACRRGHVGCEELYDRVMQVKPMIHAFGHIHEGHGQAKVKGIQFINSAIMDGAHFPLNKPIVYNLGVKK
jgi:Icc-related predicted phosphoesterase